MRTGREVAATLRAVFFCTGLAVILSFFYAALMHRLSRTALLCIFLGLASACFAQKQPDWTAQEKPIADQIRSLRSLYPEHRASLTKELALEIRKLPTGEHKLLLAGALSSRATEGDFGRDTLQEVTTTLEQAVREHPVAAAHEKPAQPYLELAELARYEHMKAALDDPQFAAALAQLKDADDRRQQADFTLTDLQGKSWTLKQLKGKVVLVNFWATWCPPCRQEMPDLDALYQRFKDQGFVILALSDEKESDVKPFLSKQNFSYPIMLDPDRKVHELFAVEGIPKSFVYNREGKLVTESIDMRTQKQFLAMLADAGMQ